MHFPKILPVLVCVVSAFLLPSAGAQSTNASLSGQVTDVQGLVVVGAEVDAVNQATNVIYSTKTNGEGIYSLPELPPGTYEVRILKDGFRTLLRPGIELHIQDARALNATLQVGDKAEIVRVEGGISLINTESAAVGTVVDQTYVKNMPLNGRSFQDLILLTSGTITQTPQNTASQLGATGEFSVNGQRPESNYYTVDGVSVNVGAAPGVAMTGAGASGSVPLATALGTTQPIVSVDDLQEFRVQSSTYSAEFGRTPGGQLAFETKSGTNQWHGTAFDYVRNNIFDANDWFNDYLSVIQPPLRQNDFGGTFGGAVDVPHFFNGKDRTFFFVSYEGLRLVQPQAATVNNVPDSALRASTPAPLNQVLNAFPEPNGTDDLVNGIAQFKSSWSNASSIDSTSVRFDESINDKLRLFFRFSDTPSQAQSRGTGNFATPTEFIRTNYSSRTYTAGVSSMFTSGISNEFRLSYSSNGVITPQVVDAFGGSTPVDFLHLSGLNPGANLTFLFIFGGYQVGIGQVEQSAVQRQWNFVDTVSLALGRHLWKFGGDFRRLTPIATPFNPLGEFLYLTKSSVQANSAFEAIAQSLAQAYPLYINFSAFAQDEWRVTSRLNLSLGVRWEVNPAPGVTQGLKPYTVEGPSPSTYTLAPEGTPLWKTTWVNLAPRVGAAYILRGTQGSETVIRGGAGIYYDTGQQLGSSGFLGPGYSSGLHFYPSASFPLPVAEAVPPIVNPPVAPYPEVVAFPADLELPYTIQWNTSLEQGLGKSQALTLSYVGSHAAKLLEEREFAGQPGNPMGNPNIRTLVFNQNGLTSDYHAFQLQFQRRFSRGLTALASYSWSHCLDYGSQNYFLPFQRGNCDFDVRHSFSGAFSYNFPNIGHGRFVRALVNDWGLDNRLTARTGFPVTLQGNLSLDPATGQFEHSGLDLVPGQPLFVYGSQCAAVYSNGLGCPGGQAINPNAFTLPAAGTNGDAPRNFLRGFGVWQMNLALRRDFPIYERLKIQFRVEAFNIFNHPNFGTINANFCSPKSPVCTFGEAIGTLASASHTLSPLYQFGGPRSMQLSLKLSF